MNTKNESLKILSIVPYKVFPALMGGQKGIALFYKYFARLVSFACITIQKNEPKEEYTVLNQISNSSSRYINFFLFFKIKKIARENDCTHLLFEHPYYAWMIVLFKLFSSERVIVHSHNIESERFKSIGKWWWKILWYYERIAYRFADYVWFKTDEDRKFAQLYFNLNEAICTTIPYGVEPIMLPSSEEMIMARKQVASLYKIAEDETIILFNGTLNYKPNLDALNAILNNINPLLLKCNLKYKILICGKNLPKHMNELEEFAMLNIVYCGFVDDIDLYFKACDIFLNPLQDGGGIKTKLVEALGFGKKCVSSVNGAIGVKEMYTEGRLQIVADKDWEAYSQAIIDINKKEITNENQVFYQVFSWQHIASKAVLSIQ